VAATGFLYWVLATNLAREDDEFLADKIHILNVALRDRPGDAGMLREEVEWEPAARRYGQVYARLLDSAGKVLMETPGMTVELPPQLFHAPANMDAEVGREVVSRRQASFRIMTGRVFSAAASGAPAVIQVALDRTREEDLLAHYRRNMWAILAVGLIVSALAGYQIATCGLKPVTEIADAAGRIRSTTLHERIETDGLPRELSTLAATFNEMLDRLQESFDRLSRFSADIAHELRNPVNNLRGEAEVALGAPRSAQEYQEVLESCLEEYGRLSRLIDNLLFVARAESPQGEAIREDLEVGRELATVRDFYEGAATEAQVTLTVEAPSGLVARLDRALLQRALGNLVANALAHTPPGGVVSLSAFPQPEGLRLEVADSGHGISREHLAHVFDRFYRVDPARTNDLGRVGLGLAIVKSIAVLHGGSADISSETGKGTRVTLFFPQEDRRIA
jgi:two-component system heavy metal sensor histidine kinase CusS